MISKKIIIIFLTAALFSFSCADVKRDNPEDYKNYTIPEVISVTPETDQDGVSVSTVVSATFSEPMDEKTLTVSTVLLKDGPAEVGGNVVYNRETSTVTFTPLSYLNINSNYTIEITGDAKSSGGIPLAGTFSSGFSTQVLGVAIKNPADGASLQYGQNYIVDVSASASPGTVFQVGLFLDGAALGNAVYSGTADIYCFTWSNIPFGIHKLKAIAVDNSASSLFSSEVSTNNYFFDNFNRADGSPGNNWTAQEIYFATNGGDRGSICISGNRIYTFTNSWVNKSTQHETHFYRDFEFISTGASGFPYVARFLYRREGEQYDGPDIIIVMGASTTGKSDGFGISIWDISNIGFINTGTVVSIQATTTQTLNTYIWAQVYFNLDVIKCKFWNNGSAEPANYQYEYSMNYTHSGNRLDFYYNGGCGNGGWHRFYVDDITVYRSE